jgi:hypothetical protein
VREQKRGTPTMRDLAISSSRRAAMAARGSDPPRIRNRSTRQLVRFGLRACASSQYRYEPGQANRAIATNLGVKITPASQTSVTTGQTG